MVSGRFQKKFQKVRNGPHSVRLAEMKWLFEHAGFRVRRGTKHPWIAYHPTLGVRFPLPQQNPLLPDYVRKGIKLIEDALELEEGAP